jgi:two-component system, cell cycle sensor histidine kinase and response regulator CckA
MVPRVGGRQTILLVDDEEMFREFLTECLEAAGYQVKAAASAEAALRLCAGQPGSFDLVITDMVMPGLSGTELVGHLHRSQPDLKILFMSGYGEVNPAAQASAADSDAILAKPFTPAELKAAVKDALGEPPEGASEGTRPKARKRRSSR